MTKWQNIEISQTTKIRINTDPTYKPEVKLVAREG